MKKKLVFTDIQVPESFCPKCFTLLDAVSNLYGRNAPDPGDFTICINCASVLRFDENFQFALAKFDDIPIQLRSEFAMLKYAVEEIQDKNRKPGATPWSSGG
jgi:hypothetical protein